jgi:hypothetical protein
VPRRPSLRNVLVEHGVLVVALVFAVYVWSAPSHIVDGDNAEFSTLGVAGGVAHPTGYPAYLLWLRVTTWLPGSTPAHTAAIATVILAVIQLMVLQAACRAWGTRAAAANLAIAVYAAAPIVMRYGSEAEVFALNQLLVTLVLYLSAHAGPLRGTWRVAALGLVAGLGIADHVTCVLVAPVGILGAIRGVREARRSTTAAAVGVVGLIAGLTPYVYLLLTSENDISWVTPNGFGELLEHVLRRAYGGPSAFSARGATLHPWANLAAFVTTLGRAWLWLPALGGLGVLGYRCIRAEGGEPVAGWRMLAVAFLLAGPLLVARFDIEPSGLSLYVARRFHLMPTLLLAIPVAGAFDIFVARHEAKLRGATSWLLPALSFALVILVTLPELARVRTPAVEHAMRAMLRRAPQNAVILVSGDITFLGTGYLQVACEERRDVTVVLWPFVGVSWYRDRLVRRGLVIEKTAQAVPSVGIAEKILATGRPLLVDRSLGNVLKELPSYPYGTLFRVLPRGQAKPSVDELATINRDWFAALDLEYPRPGPDDEYPAWIHEEYAMTWHIIARAFADLGRREDAANAAALASALGPQS